MYSSYREQAPYRSSTDLTSHQRNNTFELETRISQLVTENEKLNLDLRDRYNEVQTWKSRFEALEKNSKLAMQELSSKLERQKMMEIEDAVSKSNNRFSMDISHIESQARTMQSTLVEYENKNRMLSEEVNRLLDERQTHEMQMRTVRQTVGDMENKLRQMASETERFNSLIAEKNQEIEVLKGKFNNFEKFKGQEMHEMMARLEQEKREIIDRELKSQAMLFGDERNRHDGKMKEISQIIGDLEQQMVYLSGELEKLQRQLDDKTREAETLKLEYVRMEDSKNIEIRNLYQQFELLKRSAISATDMEGRYHAERSALESEILQVRQKSTELEGHVRNLAQENEKLTSSYYELQRENEELRLRRNRPDGMEGETDALRRENDKLRGISLEGNELRVRFDVEKENYETQIGQLRQVLQVNKAEIEKLYSLLDVRRQENEHLTVQLNEARGEIAKMDNICKELDSRYAILANKYEHLGKEAQSLQRSRDLFKHQIERGNMDIAMKNRELMEKIKEVDMLKKRYEESLHNFRADLRM